MKKTTVVGINWFFNIFSEIELNKLTHTLVMVRLAWTNGANYNFFGGIAKGSLREKNWSWRLSLSRQGVIVSFGQAKENKK